MADSRSRQFPPKRHHTFHVITRTGLRYAHDQRAARAAEKQEFAVLVTRRSRLPCHPTEPLCSADPEEPLCPARLLGAGALIRTPVPPGQAFCQRLIRLPSVSWKYALNPMSPTGCRPIATLPPSFSTRARVSSRSATPTVITGAVIGPWRRSMPPLIPPISVRLPRSSVGVVVASTY